MPCSRKRCGISKTIENFLTDLFRQYPRFFGYNCQAHAHSFYPATLWSDNELFPLNNDPPIPGHAKYLDRETVCLFASG